MIACRRLLCFSLLLMVVLSSVVTAAKPIVTIATYSMPRYEIIRDRLLPKWQAAHPDIEIQVLNFPDFWNKLLVLIGTDQAPDIVDTAGTYIYGHVIRGGAVDLAPLLKDRSFFTKDSFWDGPWNEVRWPQPNGSSIYGLPYDTVAAPLWYNKQVLSNAGIDMPSESWSWNDLRAAARKIAADINGDGQNDIWGFSAAATHEVLDPLIKSFGGQILKPDRKSAGINSPEAIAAVQFLTDMIHQDRSTAMGVNFSQGKLGLYVGGTHNINVIGRVQGLEWGMTMIPKGPVSRTMYGGSNMWEVMRRPGQDLQAISVVLRELLSQQTIEAFWTSYTMPYSLPSVRNVASRTKLNEIQMLLAKAVPYMADADWSPDWAQWQTGKRSGLEPVLRGQRSAEEGVLRAAEEIDKVLKQAYGAE